MTMNEEVASQDQLFDIKLKKYEEQLVAFFTDIGEQKRVNSKFLKMSSYLFIHKKLTQKLLKKLTGFSTGTISTFLSVMLGTEFFEKKMIPGTHTCSYRSNATLEDLTSKGLDTAIQSFLLSEVFLKDKIGTLDDLIKQNKKGASHLSQRIDEILDIFKFYKELFPEMMNKKLEETD